MRKSLKFTAALGGGALVLATAGAAYAYWTSTGTGQGSATVGDSANNVYLRGTAATTLTPETSSSVTFTAKNFAAFGQSISKIHLVSVAACVGTWSTPSEASYPVPASTCPDNLPADTTSDANCGSLADGALANTPLTKDYYMADVTVDPSSTTGGKLAANADRAVAVTSPSTLLMNNTSSNQDDCKNKNLLLTFSTT